MKRKNLSRCQEKPQLNRKVLPFLKFIIQIAQHISLNRWTFVGFIILSIILITFSFIMAPRKLYIENKLVDLVPYNLSQIKDSNSSVIGLVLYFEEKFTIHNYNFYKIKLDSVNLKIKRKSINNLPKLSYSSSFEVGPLSENTLSIKIEYVVYRNDVYVDLCLRDELNDLFSYITTSFTYSTFIQSNCKHEVNNLQFISCKNKTIETV